MKKTTKQTVEQQGRFAGLAASKRRDILSGGIGKSHRGRSDRQYLNEEPAAGDGGSDAGARPGVVEKARRRGEGNSAAAIRLGDELADEVGLIGDYQNLVRRLERRAANVE